MEKTVYELMHGEKIVADIGTNGVCTVLDRAFLPFSIYLEDTAENDDLDIRMDNLTNFYYWCATRVLTLDRVYAKEILNSIGALQAQTDRDRAKIALSYHCLSLTDIFWVREKGENITFSQINLFENHLDNAFVDISLRGKQMTVENSYLIADDLSTNGVFPKAWIREKNSFALLKDGNIRAVKNEILSSKICRCFDCRQVLYEESMFDGQKVSKSRIITSVDYSMVSMEAFEIYAANHDIYVMDFVLKLDAYSYYMMNLLDYLTGNTDRHWGNWGFLVDNRTNQPVRLFDLMDLNQTFLAYDTIEGANCMTTGNRKISQREAAVEAVKIIGLNQRNEIKDEWFKGREKEREMFWCRFGILKEQWKA